MKLLNYTPHRLVYQRPGRPPMVLPSIGIVRCAEDKKPQGSFDSDGEFPRIVISYGQVSGLPEPQPGVVYVVSQLVVATLPHRPDLAFPVDLVRNADGDVVGFESLGRLASD